MSTSLRRLVLHPLRRLDISHRSSLGPDLSLLGSSLELRTQLRKRTRMAKVAGQTVGAAITADVELAAGLLAFQPQRNAEAVDVVG